MACYLREPSIDNQLYTPVLADRHSALSMFRVTMSAPRMQLVQCAVLLLNVLSSPWPTSAQEPGEILICHGDVACKYRSATLCIAGNYDYVMPDFQSYSTGTVIQL